MTSVVSLRPLATGPAIHVDLAATERPMREALRRAAVFLGYAVRSTEGAPLASVSLNAVIELDVGVGDCTGGMLFPLAAAQTRVSACRLGPNVRPWRSPALSRG